MTGIERELRRDMVGTVSALNAERSKVIEQAGKLSFLRQCLKCADRAADDGDTEAILRVLDTMRESLGMTRDEAPEEWTTADILAHAG